VGEGSHERSEVVGEGFQKSHFMTALCPCCILLSKLVAAVPHHNDVTHIKRHTFLLPQNPQLPEICNIPNFKQVQAMGFAIVVTPFFLQRLGVQVMGQGDKNGLCGVAAHNFKDIPSLCFLAACAIPIGCLAGKRVLVSRHALTRMAGKNPTLRFVVIAFFGMFIFFTGFNMCIQTVVILKNLDTVILFVNQ
jgi:hypothetical protein